MLGITKNVGICLVLLFLAGCGDDLPKTPGLYVTEGRDLTIAQMKPRDVIVKVNGTPLTKHDYDINLSVRENLFRLESGIQLAVKNDRVDDYVSRVAPYGVMELIHYELFRQYAERNRLKPTEKAVEEQRKAFLKAIGQSQSSMEDLGRLIGGEVGKRFAELPYLQARDCVLRQSITTNDLTHVTDDEIAAREKYVEAFDKKAKRLNDESRARLMKAKAKLEKGLDFAYVTRRFAQVHPEHGESWGEFQIVDFPADEPLHAWLEKADVGAVSDPVDLEDGLAIVKLVKKGKGAALPGMPAPDTYQLVRCTVYAYQYMQHQDRAEMTQQLLEWKVQDAQRELGMKLMSEAVLEYPHGTNLFTVADEELKR